MGTWKVLAPIVAVVGMAALTALGQVPPPPPTGQVPAPPLAPGSAPAVAPPAVKPDASPAPTRPARDLAKLPIPHRQMYLAAQRGADWLVRANGAEGRFVSGIIPALRAPLEGENYLHQAAAATALARAAQFFQDEKAAAIARQALLTLLLDTEKLAGPPAMRRTAFPSKSVNRLAAAGWLVLAIHELPSPGADLLAQSEELCAFIRSRQRTDGSFVLDDGDADKPAPASETMDAAGQATGPALYALVRSHVRQQAAWKVEAVKKACQHYRGRWKQEQAPALASWFAAAAAEAWLLTRDQALADAVHELSDWLCQLQYQQLDARRAHWQGGFMGWAEGKAVVAPPEARSAALLEGLGQACRVAKQAGDLQRYQRYRAVVERGLQFVMTLQYTEANAQHFAEWYRADLIGGLHLSHQNGDLRLDCTQQGVAGLVKYLADVAEVR